MQAVEGRGNIVTHHRSGAARLLVFGGRNNETYLGCLCGEYESDSVTNSYGNHGSRYATDSIWNRYGDFGSKYSNSSACNAHATKPPIVVSSDGDFIGYLTVNKYMSKAITEPAILEWLAVAVCADS